MYKQQHPFMSRNSFYHHSQIREGFKGETILNILKIGALTRVPANEFTTGSGSGKGTEGLRKPGQHKLQSYPWSLEARVREVEEMLVC